jgi:hypothetical protein
MLFNALTVLSIIASAHATGRAIVTNQCPEPIYLWSVGGSISDQHIVNPATSYSESFVTDPKSGGIAIKISPIEGGEKCPCTDCM